MLPKFRPIVDTTSVCYYNVGSYLIELLNPLAQNEFVIRGSVHAANKMKSIPPEVFDDGYIFESCIFSMGIYFDVESLFTNVPLQRTINIILDRVYNNKLRATQLKKQTLKKLIKDTCSKTCSKTVLSANKNLYKQIDDVGLDSSLGRLLANIYYFHSVTVGLRTAFCRRLR